MSSEEFKTLSAKIEKLAKMLGRTNSEVMRNRKALMYIAGKDEEANKIKLRKKRLLPLRVKI